MNAPASIKRNLEHWNSIFSSRTWGRYPPVELVRFIARNFFNVHDRRVVRILEIGCGPGPNVWFMAREGFSVSGIDGSAAAIEQLRARLLSENIVFDADEFVVSNFARLPWPDEVFDAVVDVEALYANQIDTVRAALKEAHRVLKPGGLIFSQMFGPRTTGWGTGNQIEPNTSANPVSGPCAGLGATHFFSEEEISEMFQAFRDVNKGWVHRSETDGGEVFEWVTTARK